MSELTLLLLKLGFLVLLWAFVFAIVYALRSDLFGERVRRMPAQASAAEPYDAGPAPAPVQTRDPAPRPVAASAPSPGGPSGSARRVVITSGAKAGTELELGDEPLTIGRSGDSGL